jgi:hypothetical protein
VLLHQPNRDIALDPRIELYLDFQIQLNLDLQAAVLFARLDGPVLDSGVVHGDDAAAVVDDWRQGVLLRSGGGVLLRGGGELLVLGVAGCGCFGSCAAGSLLESLAEFGRLAAAGGVGWSGGDVHVGEAALFGELAGFCRGAVEERSALHDYGGSELARQSIE